MLRAIPDSEAADEAYARSSVCCRVRIIERFARKHARLIRNASRSAQQLHN